MSSNVVQSWQGKGAGVQLILGWGMQVNQIWPLFKSWATTVIIPISPINMANTLYSLPSPRCQIAFSMGACWVRPDCPSLVLSGAWSVGHPSTLRLFRRDPQRFMTQFWDGVSPMPSWSLSQLEGALVWLDASADRPAPVSPTYWYHATGDAVIPPAMVRNWISAGSTQLGMIPNHGHTSWWGTNEAEQLISHFLEAIQ